MTGNPPPRVDGRRRTTLREEATERVRAYTPELDPDADGVGTALLGLFAEIVEDVTERLDRTPEKHRVAFFDELGFDRDPPQPARLPLVFQAAEGLSENVAISSGTQAVSEPEGDEAEQTFEIARGEGFEATPARLQEVYSVHPDGDAIFEHQPGPQTDPAPRLFDGENQQSHVLYLGHPDFFNLKRENGDSDQVTEFDVRIDAPKEGDVFETLRWSYYGTRDVDGESVEGWYQLGLRPQSEGERETAGSLTVLRFALPAGGAFAETTLPKTDPDAADAAAPATGAQSPTPPDVTEVASRWIKCEPPSEGVPEGLFDVRADSVSLSLPGLSGSITDASLEPFIDLEPADSSGTSDSAATPGLGSLGGVTPDMLLANDVPLPRSEKTLYPFGKVPRPLDAFYVGSEDVLTKTGQRILLVFPGIEDGPTPEAKAAGAGGGGPSLDLSWEYWNGSGWDYLPKVEDHFTEGWVGFDLPTDAEGTTVAGHDGHWIRVRVLEDGYVEYEEKSGNPNVWEMIAEVVPRFEDVWLFYMGNSSDGPSNPSDSESSDSRPERPPDEGARATGSTPPEASTSSEEEATPPRMVRDAVSTPPEHVVAYNNLSYGRDEASRVRGGETESGWFTPFRRLPDETQAVYLGFDGTLDDGPIQVLFSSEAKAYPDDFYPRARWEYCVDGSSDSWVRLSAEDETDCLTRRGIVSLVFPEPTTRCELFGRERHWVRAQLVGKQFQSTDETVLDDDRETLTLSEVDPESGRIVIRNTGFQKVDLAGYRFGDRYAPSVEAGSSLPGGSTVPPGGSLVVGTRRPGLPPDVELDDVTGVLERVAPNSIALLTPEARVAGSVEGEDDHAGDTTGRAAPDRPPSDEKPRPCGGIEPPVLATSPIPTESPPVLRGIYPNAGWADNVRTVTDEVLGPSDGEPDQEFSFANQPVIDETVRIGELSALGEDAREALKRDHPERVEERTDEAGDVTEFRVRWTRVDDFVGSAPDDRHYVVDRTAGMLTFGDGTRGAIPPRGEDNVRADYRTGGGVDGNVRDGSVVALTSALPFVDSVTNPEPGAGGANAETRAEALRRASRTLRDRNRAVTRVDFERLAKAASRGLERVRCIPGMGRTGATRVGWVTVLIVPRSSVRKPVPSPEVTARVEETLRRHAPAPLTGPTEQIVVRGPSYVEVRVDSDLVASDDVPSVAAVEEAAAAEVVAFLHPLTGGPDGAGWGFGELPCVSDFYALLEGVEGVDHVEHLEVTFRGRERGYTVTDDDRRPEVTEDTLVFSGVHEIAVGGGTGGVDEPTEGVA